jgi:epoxyqueuosine reductase
MSKTELLQQLEERGYRARVVKIERLHALREEIENRLAQGLIDEATQRSLGRFVFSPPESMPNAQSLIVIAIGEPQIRLTFARNGQRIQVIAPPEVLYGRTYNQQAENALAEILGPEGYRAVRVTTLPAKLLAVRSGLAAYGRNNISYVAGLGSFYRLKTFYSDLPCRQDEWQEKRMLERCQKCSACVKSCPSGAIRPDRFLIDAGRCITRYNERPDLPFPEWLDPSWHNCLMGCLRCQRVCPGNENVVGWLEEGPEFSSEETALLLEGVPLCQLPAAIVEKLEQTDLVSIMYALPRNLEVLFKRHEQRVEGGT